MCSAGRWLTEPKHVADGKLLMNLCLDLCLYSFINSIFEHNGDALIKKMIDHDTRTESRRKVSQAFNNNSQGSRPRGRPKNRWWNCVPTGTDKCKITNWKERSKTELTGRRPLRRRRSVLDWSAIEEKEGGEEEEVFTAVIINDVGYDTVWSGLSHRTKCQILIINTAVYYSLTQQF